MYDLPTTEEAIKWMNATYRYPVKSTWLKAIKAGNFTGWPVISKKEVTRYYPETDATPKGHMSQTRKNGRSMKKKDVGWKVNLKAKQATTSRY